MLFQPRQTSQFAGRRLLFLGLAIFVIARQLTWSLVNPLFQAPDEVAHIQMASQMDRHDLAFYRLSDPTTDLSNDAVQDWIHEERRQLCGTECCLRFRPPGHFGLLHLPEQGSDWTVEEKIAGRVGSLGPRPRAQEVLQADCALAPI